MAVYRFKITIDEDEDVTRDIEVRSGQGFSTLHKGIVEHFNFRPDQPAEYFSSDQQWYEGDRIIKLEPGAEDKKRLADYIYDPHQRFICITESYNEVALAIELQKVSKEVEGAKYPRCVASEGEPPYYTQPPLEHLPNEDEEPELDDMLLDLGDEPSDADLAAAEAEAENVDIKMPDFTELLKAVEADDAADDSSDKEEKKSAPQNDDSHSDFNMDDL